MTHAPVDRQARLQALDAERSFIVQAPAGSGKTELLIQRYLKLLAGVERPEQIVAITFTRKAAAEMRARIVGALNEASSGRAPAAAYRAETLRLAEDALARDRQLDWRLLGQPQRLRIETLDALNANLARQLPLLAGGVAGASVVEDCTPHYRRAARRTVAEMRAGGPLGNALRELLGSLDHSVPRLELMLAQMLPGRDQWLRHVGSLDDEHLRKDLEAALKRLVAEELDTLASLVPDGWLDALWPLGRHAAVNADDAATRAVLAPLADCDGLAADVGAALAEWRGIAQLLLTGAGAWRQRLTKREGFARHHKAEKEALAALLDRVRDDDKLRAALRSAVLLPEPGYTEAQWRDLKSLRHVLTHVLAELTVAFAEHGIVDFVELALGAKQALGRVDRPSELLLALDRRIQHLLVDEFQDTSQAQLELLELLTAGWEPGDGRSLFLVGDPMQSIYRFRDADMSLFLKIKQRPIGQIRCNVLILQSNFRSAPAIVDWVNSSFAAIFPDRDRIGTGAARFHSSTAERDGSPDQRVSLHLVGADELQAEQRRVVEVIDAELARAPERSIAVLVRSRRHLVGLRERLAARGHRAHATEIDPLAETQLGQDLIGLARALGHLADRIAWLGVLRAPWSGLTWRDLEALCADAPQRTIWDLINDPDRVCLLTDDGRRRVGFVRRVLARAFSAAGGMSFSRWLEQTWRALHGPEEAVDDADREVAEAFFERLEAAARDGEPPDNGELAELFAKPQAERDPPLGGGGVEIMTIHRAKGLEFDTVIVFGLARVPLGDSAKALYWAERVNAGGDSDLLLAPLPREGDRLAAYLMTVERRKEASELARLLYVAATRARDRLHLIAALGPDVVEPPARSLLHCLWPTRGAELIAGRTQAPAPAPEPRVIEPRLLRSAEIPPLPEAAPGATKPQSAAPEFEWAGRTARHVGTVVHEYLQRMAEDGLDGWDDARVAAETARFRDRLRMLGVEPAELNGAAERVAEALGGVLDDERGRWLLSARPGAAAELRLTIRNGDVVEHAQLDRTFVEEGLRWIVDYKTGAHEGAGVDAFLDSEVERYRPQLERYARHYAELDALPVRVGLYFPLLGAFRDWNP